ncbi:MAG: hypothetical protein MUC60_00870 [Oscillatoria sp. Prado101]|nr:hypothetical protein [Oscillatoria sp. Prado101]
MWEAPAPRHSKLEAVRVSEIWSKITDRHGINLSAGTLLNALTDGY